MKISFLYLDYPLEACEGEWQSIQLQYTQRSSMPVRAKQIFMAVTICI
jgi:hypothetical protein